MKTSKYDPIETAALNCITVIVILSLLAATYLMLSTPCPK